MQQSCSPKFNHRDIWDSIIICCNNIRWGDWKSFVATTCWLLCLLYFGFPSMGWSRIVWGKLDRLLPLTSHVMPNMSNLATVILCAVFASHTQRRKISYFCVVLLHNHPPKKRMFAHAQGFNNMAKLILNDCLALHVMYVVNSPPWIWELLELFIMHFWNSWVLNVYEVASLYVIFCKNINPFSIIKLCD